MLALLAARFNDLDLADDAIQDALLHAAQTWTRSGIPANPPGWLYTVAHNRMVDALRRRAAADRRLRAAAPDLVVSFADAADIEPEEELIREEGVVGDEQLRLILLCCHPALDRDTQVAMTLRLVGGLTTSEIAAAFLVPEATLAQRIVRAKRKIREARMPLSIPADLRGRVDVLLSVLYLIFNEGYLSRDSRADSLVRVDLADEAMRLTGLVSRLLPEDGEVLGLLALERFHRARFAARVNAYGELVLLGDQDRQVWDGKQIAAGRQALGEAVRRDGIGPYRLQALIASVHVSAPTAGDTDWRSIVFLYRMLERFAPGPVVALNRAIAVAEADGPLAGLAEVEEIDGLDTYHLWHAARGEMLLRLGDAPRARAAFEAALSFAHNPTERRHLARRVKEASERRSDR